MFTVVGWVGCVLPLCRLILNGYCSGKAKPIRTSVGPSLWNTLLKKGLHAVCWKHIVLSCETLEVRNYFGPLLLRIILHSVPVLTLCSFSPCTLQQQLTFYLLVFSAVCQPNTPSTGRKEFPPPFLSKAHLILLFIIT